MIRSVSPQKIVFWQAHLDAQAQSGLTIAELQPQYDSALEAIEAPVDYYANGSQPEQALLAGSGWACGTGLAFATIADRWA